MLSGPPPGRTRTLGGLGTPAMPHEAAWPWSGSVIAQPDPSYRSGGTKLTLARAVVWTDG